MMWNWQKPGWPHFSWDKTPLAKAEEQFLLETGVFAGTTKHLGPEDREQLTVEAMSSEALTTSEIEGEILDRASVQSSIRKQLGLPGDNRRAGHAEQGIAEMMVDLYRRFAEPLSGLARGAVLRQQPTRLGYQGPAVRLCGSGTFSDRT